jgi:ACDE family multidrug resistance protein
VATSDRVTADGVQTDRVLTRETLQYYLGGFLGPFGTMVVISIYPELRATFDATSAEVNWAFSGYLLPMALLLFVSGTIGERVGRKRVTRATFMGYSAASVLCAVAPTLELFVAARVLQGVGNSFVTPLLIAGLTEVIDPSRLGRAIGVYSSFQAAGAALAPLAGGLAATVDWRLVFVAVAIVSLLLATRPPEGDPRPAESAPPIRPLFSARMAMLWLAAFTAAAGPIGVAVLVGLYLRDELDIGSTVAGVVLLLGGFAAMLLGPTWGRLLDSWGPTRASAVSVSAAVLVTAPLGLITNLWTLLLVWMAAAALVGFVVINIQSLSATAVPDNRGGALSSVLAFRFIGHAVGPLVWVPVFAASPEWAFFGSASLGVVTLVSLVAAARRDPPPAQQAR